MRRIAKDNNGIRQKRTKELLLASYLSLMDKDRNATLSVTDICENTTVNRGTFYLHYSGMEDFLSSLENSCYEELVKAMNQIHALVHFTSEPLFDMIENNKNLFRYYTFYSRGVAKEKWTKNLKEYLQTRSNKWKKYTEEQLDLMVHFLVGGLFTYFVSFYEHNFENKRFLVDSLDTIVTNGTRGMNQLV